jgi:hypothetical protein
MLVITTRCDDEACMGAVGFAYEGRGRKRASLLGTCGTCGSTYSLCGGQIRRLPDLPPHGRRPGRAIHAMPQRLAG